MIIVWLQCEICILLSKIIGYSDFTIFFSIESKALHFPHCGRTWQVWNVRATQICISKSEAFIFGTVWPPLLSGARDELNALSYQLFSLYQRRMESEVTSSFFFWTSSWNILDELHSMHDNCGSKNSSKLDFRLSI